MSDVLPLNKRDEREQVLCLFCRVNDTLLYAKAKSRYDDRRFDIVQCRRCGLVYVNPRIANKADEIRERPSPPPQVFRESRRQQKDVVAHRNLIRLERYIRPGRLLDFGCGIGVLVHEACKRGWDAVGIDINIQLVTAANRHWGDQRLVSTPLERFVNEHQASFDAIVSVQTFEHLCNPLETLFQLRSLLRPGGAVYVAVPNLLEVRERMRRGSSLDPTAHLYYFTERTLRALLDHAGFTTVHCSGKPGLLHCCERLLGSVNRLHLAPFLAELLHRLPMPAVGPSVYAIAVNPGT